MHQNIDDADYETLVIRIEMTERYRQACASGSTLHERFIESEKQLRARLAQTPEQQAAQRKWACTRRRTRSALRFTPAPRRPNPLGDGPRCA